jgi:hypothetical protein
MVLGCGLRRSEAAALTMGRVERRDGRWCVVKGEGLTDGSEFCHICYPRGHGPLAVEPHSQHGYGKRSAPPLVSCRFNVYTPSRSIGMKTLEYLARALALLWAGFWTFFFIAESLAWNTPVSRMTIWTGVGLLFVILALVGWRWEVTGGLLLIAAGVVTALAYAIWAPRELYLTTRATTLITFGVPPAVAGALFLMHHHGITHRRAPGRIRG